jgi:hypothetical protein
MKHEKEESELDEDLVVPEFYRFKWMCAGCVTIDDVISTLKNTTAYFERLKSLGCTIGGGINDDYMEICRACVKCKKDVVSLGNAGRIGEVYYCEKCQDVFLLCSSCDWLNPAKSKKCVKCGKKISVKLDAHVQRLVRTA